MGKPKAPKASPKPKAVAKAKVKSQPGPKPKAKSTAAKSKAKPNELEPSTPSSSKTAWFVPPSPSQTLSPNSSSKAASFHRRENSKPVADLPINANGVKFWSSYLKVEEVENSSCKSMSSGHTGTVDAGVSNAEEKAVCSM